MRPLAVGLIGAGKHGQRYAHHIRADVPELTLAAICRRDATAGTAQARAWNCRFHAHWEALIRDPGVQVVIAVVPPTLHPGIVQAVIAAGKPLLIEKPLAINGTTAIALAHQITGSNLPCLMAHTLRWNAVIQTLRTELPALGELHALYLNQRFEASTLPWLDDPAVGGGIINHTGVHSFDLVRFLTGREVRRVWCRSLRVDTRHTDDNFSALLELDGDARPLVLVSGCRSTTGRSGLVDIAGGAGQVVGDHALGFAYRVQGVSRTAIDLPPPLPTVREALRAFVRAVRDRTPPLATVADGARAVLIADACRRAAESGTAVAVPTL